MTVESFPWQGTFNSIGLLFVGGFITWFLAMRSRKVAADAELQKRIVELEKQLSIVNQAVVPITAAFQAILIKELTHFHTPVMDALLAKLGPPYTLTEDEEKELIEGLKQRTKDMGDQITEDEREVAMIMPFVIKRVRAEAFSMQQTGAIQVVQLPPDAEGEAKPDETRKGQQQIVAPDTMTKP